MGHHCRMCGRSRANEAFSGRGHRQHICKDCWPQRNSAEQKRRDDLELIYSRLFGQRNVSSHNLAEFAKLALRDGPGDETVAELASLARQICMIYPSRRKRWRKLWQDHRGLFEQFRSIATRLGWWDELVDDDVMGLATD